MSAIIKHRKSALHISRGRGTETLKGIDLEIEEGSFVAVLGHNGSGKSTLAKHFNAILTPTEGRVLVDGMDTADENNLLAVRRTVGMVFQNPDNQIVANVVEDDVAFAPENLGVEPAEIRRRVDAALKQVGMYEYRSHAPHLLSGGQKQRVAIAGVIAMEPRVIALDEPTAMLDPQGRAEVLTTVTGCAGTRASPWCSSPTTCRSASARTGSWSCPTALWPWTATPRRRFSPMWSSWSGRA
jgi:energy-coupling factor transport system ATP-binding protein